MHRIIDNNKLEEKENRLLIYVMITVLIVCTISITDIFLSGEGDKTYLQSTIRFIRTFNCVTSILAFGSCIIAYNRLKKDSVFFISLIYLSLSIDILLGYINYLSFYAVKLSISNYTVICTSVLRVFILILSIRKNNKISKIIIDNKELSIIILVAYSVLFGLLEINFGSKVSFYNSSEFFVLYNIFLMIIYGYVGIKLFRIGLKSKEYLFIVLSASIFLFSIKAIYGIYSMNCKDVLSFYINLTAVSITFISFFIVITGSFVELYIYICKTKVLNRNLSTFYDLAENSNHSCMFISDENYNLLYANKKIKENYNIIDNDNLKELEEILKNKLDLIGNKNEIMDSLQLNGFWSGIIKNDKENRYLDCYVHLIISDEEYKQIVVSYSDVSQEINTQFELEKLKVYDKEKSEFIANLAHELKTPLNIFSSTIQLLERDLHKNDLNFKSMYIKYEKHLKTNCKRMLRLINNIMDISQIEEGLLKPNFGIYNIVSIVEDVTLSVSNFALLKKIYIQFDTNVEESIIECDPTMIERVILNLLSNAIKFSNENNNIYVNVIENNEWIEILIRDEGIGIEEKNLEHIFKRFVQCDKSFTRANEGSGIGLSIVKSIVEAHDGNISVESKLNKGSKFIIKLPNKNLKSQVYDYYNISNNNIELELSDIYEIV